MKNEVPMKVRIAQAMRVVPEFEEHEIDPNELATIAADIRLKPGEMRRLAGILVYIRKRMLEKKSQIESFRIAFPERSVGEDGKELKDSTIATKAQRLESMKIYRDTLVLIQAPLHVAYIYDRFRVLDEALKLSLDNSVPTRDRYNYMKLFLDETRKPDEAKGMEVNVNLTQNNVSIRSVEQHLGDIAKKFKEIDASAEGIIDAITVNRDEKENQPVVVE